MATILGQLTFVVFALDYCRQQLCRSVNTLQINILVERDHRQWQCKWIHAMNFMDTL